LLDLAPPKATKAEILDEWRTGWKQCLAAFLAGGLGIALWASLSSLFIKPMRAEFGWTGSEFAFVFNASIIVALLSPLMGRMVDGRGARTVALGSISLLAIGYLGLGLMWNSLPAFYLVYLFTMTVGAPGGGMSLNRAISQTFVKSRGLALAVTRSGMAIAATVMPPITYFIIAHFGWRIGFITLAAMLILIALPVCYFFLPQDSVKGASTDDRATPKPATLRALACDSKVLVLCAATGLGYAPCIALLQLSQPILIDKGIEPVTAAALIGAMGASGFVSGIVGGVLVDRLWAPLVICAAMLVGIGGCLLIMPETIDPRAALLGTIALGIAQGAQLQVTAYLIARYLGLANFSAVFGLVVLVIAMLVPLYINLITLMREALGTHIGGLSLCIASFGAALITILGIGRYPRETSSI
jgi:predicted MFS family arabinose efflux permease